MYQTVGNNINEPKNIEKISEIFDFDYNLNEL